MRTDSTILSVEGLHGARVAVESLFGHEYLSAEPRQYQTKSKSAQEAHEAIRPAGANFIHPKDSKLSGSELALYELIWKRTLATQMAEAKKLSINVQIGTDKAIFQANGSTILFAGFLRVYVEGSDDPDAALEDREVVLPRLSVGDVVDLAELLPQEHATKPPARYTDASLVKTLEQDGVGRPSTYASIIGTIIDRGYVQRMNNALAPTFTAFAVNQLLAKYFASLVDVKFTSRMEQALDEIAVGDRQWQPYLKEFYAGPNGFHEQITTQEKLIDPKESRSITLPHLPNIGIRVGKFGPYLVQNNENSDDTHASIPEGIAPADLTQDEALKIMELQKNGPTSIGDHPETGDPVFVLTGRFGPYVQAGEKTEALPKPKRASLPKGMDPRTVTIEEATKFLSLPKILGVCPGTDNEVTVNVGRFGPYVVSNGEFRSLKKDDDVYTVTLERACELLAEEKSGRGGQSKTVRDLGAHPKDKKPILIMEGKYGLYVKHGRTNASLPKDSDPATMSPDQAIELLNKRKKSK
jgi:DNA topoisomerase-1